MKFIFRINLLLFFICNLFFFQRINAQIIDSSIIKVSNHAALSDTISNKKESSFLEKIIVQNSLLNCQSAAIATIAIPRKYHSTDSLFYVLLFLLLFFAIVINIFYKYFSNLVRVFFQTSLKQSQLTDQLKQAGLPATLMNIFFVVSGALYTSLIIIDYKGNKFFDWRLFGYMVLTFILLYTAKHLSLLFMGWLTGHNKEAEAYSFIVFLFNKIMAVVLLPISILIAFAQKEVANIAFYTSLILIGLILFIRSIRALSLLQHRFRLNRFHFSLYILGLEILPILMVCKIAHLIFSKIL